MSSLEKMSIQGVRSFGPDDEHRQVIEFFSPLTLILGPNGTGKTTIIECLKYITTGDLPPGGKQNAAFIHDPKIAGEAEVKAKVQLLLRDVQSKRCNVIRSLLATQKAKKTELKTLEGVIHRKDQSGQTRTISSKCAEMDRELVSLLGVAKPVLDSVIFCHQEESNWPLSEGKALKTRFDDIFASTRYVKALEVIRKFRQEQNTEIKIYSKDIQYLKQNKDKATELKADLTEQETKYLSSKEVVVQIKEKMEPILEKLDKLRARSQDVFKLQTKIEKMQTERSQIEKSQRELRQNIQNEFQGSTNELEKMLEDFSGNLEKKETELIELEGKEDKIKRRLFQVSDEKNDLLMQQGKLQQEAERHKKNIKSRDKMIEKLADEYNVTGYTAPLSDRQINQFLKVLDDKEQDMEEELKKKRAIREEDEAKVQEEIDDLRNTKTKLETELQMKQETLTKNRREIRDINDKLSRVDASAGKLSDIQRDLKKTERELDESQRGVDVDVLKTEVVQLQKDKSRMDAELKTLDAELNRLTRESSARTQLDIFKKERTSKVDNVRKFKSKIEDSMKHLVGHMPTENLRRELDKVQSKNVRCLRGANEKLQLLKNEKTQRETQKSMLRDQLNMKEEELRGYEDRLSSVSGSQNFDDGLEKIQADLKKSQEEKGHLKGVDYLYRKYKETLGGDDPPCPLCHRPFDNTSEVDELIDEIQSKLNMVPDKLDRVQNKIDTNTRKVEDMLQLKPVKSAMIDLTSDVIPNLKQKINALTEQMNKLSTDIDDKSEEVDSLSGDDEMAKGIQTEVAMIDKIQAELKDLDRKIAQQSSGLSGGDSDRSLHDVQGERENVLDELELVNRNLDRKRQKISDQQERLQHLNKLINELRSEKLQIESDLQQRVQLETKRIDLESNNDSLDREIKDSKEEMKPLQSSIVKKEKHKQELQRQKEDEYDIGLVQISEVKEDHRNVQSNNKEIHDYMAKGKDKELERNSEAMDSLENKASRLTEEQEHVVGKIQQMKDDLSSQKVRERELSDCLTVRRKQQEMEDLEQRIADLEEKMGGVDTTNLHQEIRDMETRQGRLVTERHQAESRQVSFETEINRIKKELRHDMFRDAEAQYTEKMIALRTTEIANQDLDKYYKALDRTIMTYHTQKMQEINKIIRELWRNTYKGNDIETIEICSDEEEGSGAAKTRRTYNYRVVMVKAGQRMDMRNRCSAGQKVLASLIIRLALAETFCLNCGILALDEPTTNLDRENIESLAYALVEIIKSRSKQRNFQLVIITHDEDFVELLGRSEYVDEFFKVRKSAEGHSQLVKAKVQDLHTR